MIIAQSITHKLPKLNVQNLEIPAGRVTGIIGPNGAGKSTLLKMLAGITQVSTGNIQIDGVDIHNYTSLERAKHVAYLEQHCFVHWPLSVEKLVSLGRFPHQRQRSNSTKIDEQVVEQVIAQLNLQSFRERSFLTLSGGERIRVLLARALATQAEYLLVDEPIASLDLQYQFEIMDILRTQSRLGIGVAVILHDMNLAAQFCDYLYLMQDGEITNKGAPQEVFTERTLADVFGVQVSFSELSGFRKMLFSQLKN